MAKYSYEFKLKVVHEYINGEVVINVSQKSTIYLLTRK